MSGTDLMILFLALCQYLQSSGIAAIFKNKHLLCLPVHNFSTIEKFETTLERNTRVKKPAHFFPVVACLKFGSKVIKKQCCELVVPWWGSCLHLLVWESHLSLPRTLGRFVVNAWYIRKIIKFLVSDENWRTEKPCNSKPRKEIN